MIEISLNSRLAAEAYRLLADRMPAATARALNKSGASGISVLAKAVAADLAIKQATIRAEMKPTPATWTRQVYRLETSGRRISLMEFKAKGRYPSRGKGGGVTAKLPGGAGRYPHAFIAYLGKGPGVYERKGTGRFPIRKLRGPSLPKVVGKYASEFFQRATEVLKKNLQHEINFETRKIAQASKAGS